MLSNNTFYDFCSFWSMAVNTVDKLQLLSFVFAGLLSILQYMLSFSRNVRNNCAIEIYTRVVTCSADDRGSVSWQHPGIRRHVHETVFFHRAGRRRGVGATLDKTAYNCMLYNCLEWYKWVLTNLYHDRQLYNTTLYLSLIHIWRCRRSTLCRSRWSPYH